ncbi:MAG: IS66 family transposase [Nanoarchaeota archaeon]|nr:IS66 family transposase [Nanoarchaeota archaeon]
MSAKKELRQFSKSELIVMLLEERQARQKLEEQLKEIEAMLRQYDNPNTPSSQERFKENTQSKEEKLKEKENKNRFPGREKNHKGSGIKLPEPDRIEKHEIKKEGYIKIGKRIKTIIEFVKNPIEVVKHIIYKYEAPDGSIVWAEADLSRGIYGKNLQAFDTLLKGKLGASHESIADLIRAFRDDISFCAATSSNIINKMAHALASERKKIIEHLRMSFYGHADETGLREDGINGHVWFFGTPTHCLYEYDLSRSGDVPKRILGKDCKIKLVVDGWQGYNGYDRQRCWPHLMRELDDLAEDSKEIQVQANYFHNLYERALEAKKKPPDERERFVLVANSQYELSYMIECLSKIRECNKFTTKLINARPYLFTGVIHPEIPLDNNYSERKIRKIVVHRKLMGCIRNKRGRRFIGNVMSAMETWHQQGKNVYQNLISFAS